MTFFVETHPYRGFSKAGGPLFAVVTIGFVSFGYAPFQLTQKIAELRDALRKLTGRDDE